jgi:hypothetical protein
MHEVLRAGRSGWIPAFARHLAVVGALRGLAVLASGTKRCQGQLKVFPTPSCTHPSQILTTGRSMHLIQLLRSLRDNPATPFPPAMFSAVRTELAEALDGVTACQRARVSFLRAARLAARFLHEQVLVRALPCECP